TAERTGSPVFHTLWSYVLDYVLKGIISFNPESCPNSIQMRNNDVVGQKYALEFFLDTGDAGHSEKGRDLTRFRCESNAYRQLLYSGACERGVIPKYYGCINQVDTIFKQRAILLEYLPNTESLNCANYSDALCPQAVENPKEIHRAGVNHKDICPK
ncbi:hypothetical protein N7451_010586, partial [Penicillium sp. IBT 35674x]